MQRRGLLRPLSALVVLVLALPRPAAAYTTKHTTDGAPVRWFQDEIQLEIDPMVAPGRAPRAVQLAADAWASSAAPHLVAVLQRAEPYRLGAPGTQIVNPESWPYDPRLLAVTATAYDDVSGAILDADILVNPAARFSLVDERDDEESYDLGSVLAHEAGHVLGLGESDSDPSATMWPTIGRGEIHQRSIEEDDLAGIAAVYETPVVIAPTEGCEIAGPSDHPSPGPLGLAIACALGALLIRRRRARVVIIAAALLCSPPIGLAAPPVSSAIDARELPPDVRARFEGSSSFQVLDVDVHEGADGIARSVLDLGARDLVIPGGCVGRVCTRVGDTLPPSAGETLLVAPSGAWARVDDGVAHGGWLETVGRVRLDADGRI